MAKEALARDTMNVEAALKDTSDRTYYFDMDGTIADLYGVNNCFQRLDAYDANVYAEAKPIHEYVDLLHQLQENGHRIGIISALRPIVTLRRDSVINGIEYKAGDTVPKPIDYDERVTKIKRAWLSANGIKADSVQIVPYATDKWTVAEDKTAVLVDDDASVLNRWHSDAILAVAEHKAIKTMH